MHPKPNKPLQQIHACITQIIPPLSATLHRPASNSLIIIIHRLIHHPLHRLTHPPTPANLLQSLPLSLSPSAEPSASSETLPLVHHKPPTYTSPRTYPRPLPIFQSGSSWPCGHTHLDRVAATLTCAVTNSVARKGVGPNTGPDCGGG
jgi:hypothetical protein